MLSSLTDSCGPFLSPDFLGWSASSVWWKQVNTKGLQTGASTALLLLRVHSAESSCLRL